jgi:hypothetical protein
MERADLLRLWATVMKAPPPRQVSMPFLRRFLAFELQARQYGGLAPGFLEKLAEAARSDARQPKKKLARGARLLREWNGETHVVDVTEAGFVWRGHTYRSLSVIARTITGAHWSGPRFFGLNAKALA